MTEAGGMGGSRRRENFGGEPENNSIKSKFLFVTSISLQHLRVKKAI